MTDFTTLPDLRAQELSSGAFEIIENNVVIHRALGMREAQVFLLGYLYVMREWAQAHKGANIYSKTGIVIDTISSLPSPHPNT